MATLNQIAAFVESHGFRADVIGDAVRVEIPWVGPENTSGEFIHHIRTVREARDVLGY